MRSSTTLKALLAPFGALVLIACVMSAMFYPMATMEMNNLPFAISNQDQGMTTPAGTVNAGDTILDTLTSASTADSPISWTKVDSAEALDAAMEDNEYYGALIVPDGFTASQAAAKAGTGEALALQVELDNAKSPIVANSLRSQITQMFASQGIDVEVTVLHQGDSTSASTNPLSIMMSQQLGIIPTVIMSIVSALLIRNAARLRPGSSAKEKAGTLGLQVCVAVFASAAIGLVVPALLDLVAGASVPYWTLFGFLWTGSFALMLCFLGAFNLATWLGALLAAATIPFGTATGILPYEALNSFWQHWVYPWAPQHYIGNGLRQILFMDAGSWNPAITGLLWAGAIGLVLLAAVILIPSKAALAVEK